jgi:uncharacterized protein involved in exopolysaccharide biosynthesis
MENLPITSRDLNIVNNKDVFYQIFPESTSENSIDFHKYIAILKRRKLVFVLPTLLILPLLLMIIYIDKPKYQSSATILIEDVGPVILSNIQDVISIDKSQDFFKTQYEIIKSRTIAEEVVDTLQLHKAPKKEDDEVVKKIKYILTAPSRSFDRFKNVITSLIDYLAGASNIQAINIGPRSFDPLETTRQIVIDQFQRSL